jgi:hypothetical protein
LLQATVSAGVLADYDSGDGGRIGLEVVIEELAKLDPEAGILGGGGRCERRGSTPPGRGC